MEIKNSTQNTTETKQKASIRERIQESLTANVVAIVIALVQVIFFIINMNYKLENIEVKLDSKNEIFENDLEMVHREIEGLRKSIDDNSENIKACNERIDDYLYNNKTDEGRKITFTETVAEKFFADEYELYSLSFISNPTWEDSDLIAVDCYGKEYTAEELVNEKLLVSYVDEEQETCFWGQYNAQNQWDGNCIVNVYKKNKLEMIMDAIYKDGILLRYEQVFVDHDDNRWVVSKRVSNGDVNTGETWTYIKENDYEKLYNMDIVVSDDIISAEFFKNHITTPLEGYYNGETSNGEYNDMTGNAYLVKYFENGLTRTIYKGNFINGDFNDKTGGAWYIVKEENTEYMYFKGEFMEGYPTNEENGIFINPINLQYIREILEKEGIDLKKVVLPENI